MKLQTLGFIRYAARIMLPGLLCAGLLSACTVKVVDNLSPRFAGASTQTIFFATQRGEDQLGRIFGEQRFADMSFGKLEVSIPPNHRPGQIEWRSAKPNPAREFAFTDLQRSDGLESFVESVHAHQIDRPGEALIFVHGFNTPAAAAAFRLAQIQHDIGIDDPAVLFTWPSAARTTGYIYDRDSVLFARDDLAALIVALTSKGRNVSVFAHSMGAHLTMETLRQLRLTGADDALSRVASVALMAPDIDIDVFHRQADAIGALPQPFVVLAAEQDRALRLSSIFTGRPRVGVSIGEGAIRRDDVIVLDFSDFATGKRFDHLLPVTSPKAIDLLQTLVDNGNVDVDTMSELLGP